MKQEVHGNLTGIRDSVIDALASLYNYEVEDGDFLPRELMQFLAKFTGALNREIAVYITRDGEIVDVSVGTDRNAGHQYQESQDQSPGFKNHVFQHSVLGHPSIFHPSAFLISV